MGNYSTIHSWLLSNCNKENSCRHCGDSDKKLDNALIHGKLHDKIPDNYMKLCRKCHVNYDRPDYKHSDSAKIKIGIASAERIKKNGVSDNFKNDRKGAKITSEHKKIISDSMSGENHHQSKLTKEDVMDIFNSKERHCDLAREFKVTYRTIYNIKTKKTWKHLNL